MVHDASVEIETPNDNPSIGLAAPVADQGEVEHLALVTRRCETSLRNRIIPN
jgi:hypothetical protein